MLAYTSWVSYLKRNSVVDYPYEPNAERFFEECVEDTVKAWGYTLWWHESEELQAVREQGELYEHADKMRRAIGGLMADLRSIPEAFRQEAINEALRRLT